MFNTGNYLQEELAKERQLSNADNTASTDNSNSSETTDLQQSQSNENTEDNSSSVNYNQLAQTETVITQEKVSVENPFVTEEVAELNAFLKKNPGLGFTDYQMLKRDTSALSEEELMKEFLSVKGGKTDKEIALELKKLELDPEDDDFETDDEKRLEIEAKRERILKDAREWRNEYVTEKLSKDVSNQEQETQSQTINEQNDAQVQLQNFNQDYYSKTTEALNGFNEVKVTIDNDVVGLPVDDSFKKFIQQGLDISTNIKRFYGEDGKMKDADSYVNDLAWYMPETREKLLKSVIEQVEARTIANQTKVRRNINFNNQVNVQGNNSDDTNAERAEAFFKKRSQNTF
ncbi:hypothetical protein ACMGDK_11485 [Chryseobacterium sp. DT-3]|uniref:hypothetical protein n=1 Tax=Chryseobacterium sp. DT-3 TaxID=3396164 RepID=UPI003F1B8510